MTPLADKARTEPYSARICVTFDGAQYPFKGTVYNQGDGDHVLFYWPAQPSTPERTELAEFKTQTKWVTLEGGCTRSPFADPDPKFVGMVSHADYELVHSSDTCRTFRSSEGIQCRYTVDKKGREVIESIEFKGARIEFQEVRIAPQDASRFAKPIVTH